MTTSWTRKKIKEICVGIDYGYTTSAVRSARGPKFLRITDIVPAHIDWGRVPYAEIDTATREKYLLRDGDIVIARTGATTGYAKLIKNPPEAIFASYLVRLRIDNYNDKRFIGIIIESEAYKNFISKNLTGSAQPQASAQILSSYEVSIPDLETQKKLASVISRYNDLIENNEKRIKVLEEMAQLLYTEWFVKFCFPGYKNVKMVDSGTEYGMIPEGWEVEKVGSLLKAVKRKPAIQATEYKKEGLFPIVDQGREFIAAYTDSVESIYTEHLIVFGDHSRCFKYCNFSFACGADGTQLIKTADFNRMPEILLYFSVLNAGLQNYSYARHYKFLKILNIIIPDTDIAKAFSSAVSTSYEQINQLRLVNIKLVKIRNLLVDQLITGKRELKQ